MTKTVTEQLREHIEHDERTLYRIAKDSGVSHSSLHKFVNQKTGLRSDQLDKLCSYFGLELSIKKKR